MPPVILITADPGVAVMVPPQVVTTFGTAATRIPFVAVPGRLSVRDVLMIGEVVVF